MRRAAAVPKTEAGLTRISAAPALLEEDEDEDDEPEEVELLSEEAEPVLEEVEVLVPLTEDEDEEALQL